MYDLIVIGGGVSGMTSATVALEDGIKKVMIIERESSLGGLLNQCIHNGFGKKRLKTEITGPEYINFIENKEYFFLKDFFNIPFLYIDSYLAKESMSLLWQYRSMAYKSSDLVTIQPSSIDTISLASLLKR